MPKGIEVKDLIVGTGEEATNENVVVANVRQFLRRGDEVPPLPLYGTRQIIDLGRRESIAGLRYGIPGMRVGGKREIIISPHLAYGEAGVPGLIPANALLRCQVELLEIREHSALLPQDWLPGKILQFTRCEYAEGRHQLGWTFTVHEGGSSRLTMRQKIPHAQRKKQVHWIQIPIQLEAEHSAELILQAMNLQIQMPDECVDWKSGFIDQQKHGAVIKDRRNGAHCLVLNVVDNGNDVLYMGVHEDGPKFLASAFYKTIDQLIRPHLEASTSH